MTEKPKGLPKSEKEKGPERALTPEEVADYLSRLRRLYCIDFTEKTGAEILLPEGCVVCGVNFSGKPLDDVFKFLIAQVDSYEPPILQEQFAETAEEEPKEVPVWLRGHEGLIWEGSHDNPLWEVRARQHKDEVTVYYERRGMILSPGKNKEDQDEALEKVKNTFSLQEWKVLKQVFDEYISLEKEIINGDEKTKREAKEKLLEVTKEENAFRKGKGMPQIIRSRIEQIIEDVSQKTRGFKKDAIDIESLTQHTSEILSQILVLNRNRGDGKESVPEINPDIKEFPSFVLNMENLANCLDKQNRERKGLTLMVGEAGTGKNVALEYLAAQTNRPSFWFPCGRGMESIDIVAHYEFSTEEGTKRFITDLVRGIQTPGALVMVDEVNSLKPEVQAILHGLGDGSRTLKYDGISFPFAEGVVCVVAGNPATYGSAGNFGEALLSRTSGQSMVMEYPALTKGELIARREKWPKEVLEQKEQEGNTLKDYACDEALVLFGELNEFSNLNDEEFALLWDVIINETTQGSKIDELENNPRLAVLVSPSAIDHVKKTLIDIRDILRIADTWRKKFERKEGGFDIVGISLRETTAVMKEYKNVRDVRKAFLEIISAFKKNPIDGLEVAFYSIEKLIHDILGNSA